MVENGPRCLIGTLYSGENELRASEAALARQDFHDWDRVRFDHLSEYEAHRRLYAAFKERRSHYDLFVKLDSDMVFRDSRSLGRIVWFMRRRPAVDHACFAVRDYMTDASMMGLHVFTGRVTWPVPENRSHPDASPSVPGARLRVRGPRYVADHAPDPSPRQAFHFGAHRMLKAMTARSRQAALGQWATLGAIALHARRNPDRRLRVALLGAWHVCEGELGQDAADFDGPRKEDLYTRYSDLETGELERILPEDWMRGLIRKRGMERMLYGPKRLIAREKEVVRAWLLTR